MRAVLAALAVSLAAAGCLGHGASTARGRHVFARSCARCHTLTGRDTHADGGDLAIGHLGVADIASFVRVMPVTLSDADVQAVARYVRARERHR